MDHTDQAPRASGRKPKLNASRMNAMIFTAILAVCVLAAVNIIFAPKERITLPADKTNGQSASPQATGNNAPFPLKDIPGNGLVSHNTIQRYFSAITSGHPDIIAHAKRITTPCDPQDRTCHIFLLYEALVNDIDEDHADSFAAIIQPPETTLHKQKGNRDARLVLLASLLKAKNISYWLLFIPLHTYLLTCDADPPYLVSLLRQTAFTFSKPIFIEKAFLIAGKNYVKVPLAITQPTSISYRVSSKTPVDIEILPNQAQLDALIQGRRYLRHACSQLNTRRASEDCAVKPDYLLAIINSDAKPASGSLALSYTATYPLPLGPLAKPFIRLYPIHGQSCIALAPSLITKPYPGREPSEAEQPAYRVAVSPSGETIALPISDRDLSLLPIYPPEPKDANTDATSNVESKLGQK